MMIDQTMAISAVQQAKNALATPAAAAPAMSAPSVSFGDMLAQLSDQTMSALKTGEAASIAALKGETSTQEVVGAILETEQAVQMTVAVRDKVVQSYLELSRMAI